MMVQIATVPDSKTHVATSKIEYRIQSSRGATAMVFLDEQKAINWATDQRNKFGDKAPSMKLTKRVTIQLEEVICYA